MGRVVELRSMCLAAPLRSDGRSTSDELGARTHTGTRAGDAVAVPINKSEINGNLVRGLLKIVQGEAQVRSSRTTKNQEKAAAASRGPSAQQGAGAKTVSTNEAAASSTARGGHKGASAATDRWEVLGEETTAATDRWEILVRRLYCCRTKRASYLVPGLE